MRTAKESIGGETTKFYYDANANIILETDELNAVTAKNVRGLHCISRENAGEDPFYYLYNAHGDVTKLVDALGNVLTDYSYDPFGNQKQQLLNAAAGNLQFSQWQAETQQINNPFRYCGEYLDGETGNYYLRARYYDPEVQRFISEDSLTAKQINVWDPNETVQGLQLVGGVFVDNATSQYVLNEPLSLNLYTYCENNPISNIDPSGNTALLAGGSATYVLAAFATVSYYTALHFAKLYVSVASMFHAKENAREQQTANDIIGKEKKGSINKEFPSQWRNKTYKEIEKAAKKGDKSAQKAKKLLNDKRFDKKDNRK